MGTIREIRKGKKMTLAQVEQRSGISTAYLSNIERGQAVPSLGVLEKLAACYEVSLSCLVEMMKTKEVVEFREGDIVQIGGTKSRYYGRQAVFKRYLKWQFGGGRGCDVAIEGETGPYEYPYIAQCAADLELVRRKEEAGS